MRTLVLIGTDHYIRNFIDTGAFGRLEAESTHYVSSARRVTHSSARANLEALPGYLGQIDDPRPEAEGYYKFLGTTMLAAARHRSRTMRHKLTLLPRRRRFAAKTAALPGLRQALTHAVMARTGLNEGLHAMMRRLRPDLVVAPSGGYDALTWDGLRSARALGIPSLLLIHNWDNLSSKGIFAVRPDYLAVWGEQSVEHAVRIHGIPRERVRAIGTPAYDLYFAHERGSSRSPFPFPYVLFAGCYAPFDEATALRRLDDLIEDRGLDLTVVYRPHPHRHPRALPDFVDEAELRHVVLDPQMRPYYEASIEEFRAWRTPERERVRPLLPPLDYYPALLENAEFVVCPLSTMLVEAAIFDRRVAVIAYDDGIHGNSPAAVVGYDHFEGIDRIEGFSICREPEELDRAFLKMAADELRPRASLRDQLGWWLHWDEGTYADRLADWIGEIATKEGLPAERPTVAAPG